MGIDAKSIIDGAEELMGSEPLRRQQHEQWAEEFVLGPHVLMLGGGGAVEIRLARKGLAVVSVVPDDDGSQRIEQALEAEPEEVKRRVRLAVSDTAAADGLDSPHLPKLLAGIGPAEQLREHSFDTLLLTWGFAARPRPEAVLETALRLGRAGGRLIVTAPFGSVRIDRATQSFGLTEFTDIVRGHCVPELLSVQDGAIRFVGRIEVPGQSSWDNHGPEVLLRMSERANFQLQAELQGKVELLRQNVRRLRWSMRYRAGSELVAAAQHPTRIWRLPITFLKMYLARRRAAQSANSNDPSPSGVALIPSYSAPEPAPPAEPLIAAILDQFSETCFRYDARLLMLSRKRWREEIERNRPSLLFVESAWHGNGGEWSYHVAEPEQTSAHPLAEVVAFCRSKGVPTVFWSKEDPPGFEEFLNAARLFDVIFTTDANCIPRYREACGHNQVYALPFAAQPAVHNPQRRAEWPLYPVCFAGSWMGSLYPERGAALARLLDGAMGAGLHIFDRNFRLGDERLRFPDRYASALKGGLPYERMLGAYRCYRVMLNANSVADSPTMFSRRVFECLACGTPVISTDSAGMRQMLGDFVQVPESAADTSRHLAHLLGDEEARCRLGHLGYRFVHKNHTYRHRLAEILGKAGLPAHGTVRQPAISVVIATNRPANVEQALDSYARQDYPDKELWLVLNNNTFDVEAVRRRVASLPNVQIVHMEGKVTLGDCLNHVLDRCCGDYIAKMDDDDLYGGQYLSDSMLAAQFTGAEVVGKGTYFTFLEGRNEMARRVLRPEHNYTDIVSGATLLVKRDAFRNTRFRPLPSGTDTAFLDDAAAAGCRIYSADRYNFVLMRKVKTAEHTWRISDPDFRKLCQDLRPGLDLERVMI